MARHSDPVNRKTQSLADKEIYGREADRNTRSPVDHAVEVTIFQLIIILRVAFEALFRKEISVQCLDRFLSRGSRTDPILHLLGHLIELPGIGGDRQGRIGIPGDQKRAVFQIHRAVRKRRMLPQLILEISAADFLEH